MRNKMKLTKKLFAILVIAVSAVIVSYFARVNDMRVDLDFVFYSFKDIPLWLMVLFAFLAGILFTVILVLFEVMAVNIKGRKLKKENISLRKELSKMRNQKLESFDDEVESESEANDDDRMLDEKDEELS
jgi:uncharacterized integral membrane protein